MCERHRLCVRARSANFDCTSALPTCEPMKAAPGWLERTERRLWLGMAIVMTFTGPFSLILVTANSQHIVHHLHAHGDLDLDGGKV